MAYPHFTQNNPDGMVQLTVVCHQCEQPVSFTVPLTGYTRWKIHGEFIQKALPDLSADHREMLVSGTCGPCFHKIFAEGK